MIYFTSDTHFFHKRMLDFRPFETVEEMNEALIENWNKVVKDNDEIYHLGDVSFGNWDSTLPILKALKGRKHLIYGNHDKLLRTPYYGVIDRFETVQEYKELKFNKQLFVMMHYPILKWNKGHYGSIHLHGHSHGSLPQEGIRRFDVGVDTEWANFAPISIDRVMEHADLYPVAEYHH